MLSLELLDLGVNLPQGKFLHGIRAVGVSSHSHWRDFFCKSRLELVSANQMLASHLEGQKTPNQLLFHQNCTSKVKSRVI